MSAPSPRPTCEQVEVAERYADEHCSPDDPAAIVRHLRTLAAEVPALRAELAALDEAAAAAVDMNGRRWSEVVADLRRERDEARAELAARTPQPAETTTFEIDGVLRSQQAEPKDDPQQQCLCCRPRGHVFAFGVDLPFEVLGTQGSIAARPSDWISRVLYAHRFEGGRKVRLTLTLLDPTDAAPQPAVPDGKDVPARLDAAADALDAAGDGQPASALRGIARMLRPVLRRVLASDGYHAPEDRAAVAAALAGGA